MYKNKLKLTLLIIISVLILLLVVFGTLLFLECNPTPAATIFNVPEQNKYYCYIISIFLFALAGGLFIIFISTFVFYVLTIVHNLQTIEIIKKLKIKFSNAKNVEITKVNEALNKLDYEVKEAQRNGVILTRPNQENKPTQQTINVTNNYNVTSYPNNATNLKTTTTTTTTTKKMPLPPPPPVTAPMGAPIIKPYN